jgi:Flp pilus assembly protein TadG
MLRPILRAVRGCRAQALIELTLILPLLLVLSLGVIEFSNMINAYLVLAHLTREAANIASREPGIKGQEPWSTNIVDNFNQLIAAASPVIRNTTDAERQQWKIIYSMIEYGGEACGGPLATPTSDPDRYRVRRSNAGWPSGITWEYGLLSEASRIGAAGGQRADRDQPYAPRRRGVLRLRAEPADAAAQLHRHGDAADFLPEDGFHRHHRAVGPPREHDMSDQRGQVLIFITLAFVLLGLFVGLAIDGGRAYLVKADLARKIDPAALAAAAAYKTGGLAEATKAACNSARMNGLNCESDDLEVTEETVTNPGGSTATGIRVTARSVMPTTFMRLGMLIGCGAVCEQVTVSVSAVAIPGGDFDLVMALDDTSSMKGSRLDGAKEGANALVDAVLPGGSDSRALLSLVPWRGCYGPAPCVDPGAIVPLTQDSSVLHGAINALAAGGGSGTNICVGLDRAWQELFASSAARPNAQKFIVLLTDAENNYSRPSGNPACEPTAGGSNNDQLNLRAYNKAQQLKSQNATIFVILYGDPGPVPETCTPPTGSAGSWSTGPGNLARCIASSRSHLYEAPTGAAIAEAFRQIVTRLPVRLVM